MKNEKTKLTEASLKEAITNQTEEKTFINRRILNSSQLYENHNKRAQKVLLRQNLLIIICCIVILAICILCLPLTIYSIVVGAPQDFNGIATVFYYLMFIIPCIMEVILAVGSICVLHYVLKYRVHRLDL